MRAVNTTIVLALFVASSLLAGDAKFDTKPAKESADKWLALVDAGNYEQSWKDSAEFFRSKIGSLQWSDTLGKGRKPFGKLINRKPKSEMPATSLPGAPDGKYVVLQFDSSFENKKEAVETVTEMLDSDGKWRVAGYFMK